VFRVIWGLVGPRHARLSALWRKLQGLPGWFRGLRAGSPNWRLAQNLLLTLGVVALLVLIAPLTLSGYGTYNEWGGGEWLEEVHEFFGNAMLMVVLAHMALIVTLSVLRRKNQVTPMVTGRTEGPGPDLLRSNHYTVAALVLAGVVAFWTWQWQEAPNGLLSARAAFSEQADRSSQEGRAVRKAGDRQRGKWRQDHDD
jgi:magnesium-transporting ATPase (P-type)